MDIYLPKKSKTARETPGNPASVLVIGAGPAGLAIAAQLRLRSIPFLLVDRESRPGGAYRDLYARNPMISAIDHLHLPGHPIRSENRFIATGAFQSYLEEYAGHFDLRPQRKPVQRVQPDGNGYRVTFTNGRVERFSVVVMATGCCDHPFIPNVVGLDRFRGEIIHSRFWQGAESLPGSRVLVVGTGISGTEIAEECARQGLKTALSSRSRKPRFVNPKPLGVELLTWSAPFERLPRSLFPSICNGKRGRRGYDRGIRHYIKEGRVALLPGIRMMEEKTIGFQNGLERQFDLVVFATGYRFQLPYLSAETGSFDYHSTTRHGESRQFPGLFYIGFRCAHGIDSQYIRGMARIAPTMARRIAVRVACSP